MSDEWGQASMNGHSWLPEVIALPGFTDNPTLVATGV